jgi:hypothetical protein
MDRRDLLKAGALGAAGTLLAACKERPAPVVTTTKTIAFTLRVSGSNVLVFPSDGKSAEMSFLLPDQEPGNPVQVHKPILMLTKGSSADKRSEWKLLGTRLEPVLPNAPFTATGWKDRAPEGDYPTATTGWVNLKWLPLLSDGEAESLVLSDAKLAERQSAVLSITAGTLEGCVPDFAIARKNKWRLKSMKGAAGKPALQALTDRVRLRASVQGDKLEIKRYGLDGSPMASLELTPDGENRVDLVIHSRVSETEPYQAGAPIKHFLPAYQIFTEVPLLDDRAVPHLAVGKEFEFTAVENTDPEQSAHELDRPIDALYAGRPAPPPLCDAGRVIRPRPRS